MLQGKGGNGYGKDGKVRVVCANTLACKQDGVIATMNDPGWWMNFCPEFFNNKQPTQKLLDICHNRVPDLNTAGSERAMAVIHELTHTSFIGYPRAKYVSANLTDIHYANAVLLDQDTRLCIWPCGLDAARGRHV